jgi:mono/diheme cytochrome c family protein
VSSGRSLFLSAGCGGCHILEAAGSHGTAGPNLDQAQPDLALALKRIRYGGGGMPAFAGTLTDDQIRQLARFVVNGNR